MGNCTANPNTVNLTNTKQNSYNHLLMLNQTKLIIEKIIHEKTNVLNMPINFRGDTILHYAVARENMQLIEFLLMQKNIQICKKNKFGLMPRDMTEKVELKRRLN